MWNLTAQHILLKFPIAEEDCRYTSPFGVRVSPLTETIHCHSGVDIASVWKAQVVAVADGVVTDSWPPPDDYYKGHPIYGGAIIIRHENGVESLYAHLSESYIREGTIVKAGDVIGRIGNTGQSDGEHLHLEIFINGERVNPLLYIEDYRRGLP